MNSKNMAPIHNQITNHSSYERESISELVLDDPMQNRETKPLIMLIRKAKGSVWNVLSAFRAKHVLKTEKDSLILIRVL